MISSDTSASVGPSLFALSRGIKPEKPPNLKERSEVCEKDAWIIHVTERNYGEPKVFQELDDVVVWIRYDTTTNYTERIPRTRAGILKRRSKL